MKKTWVLSVRTSLPEVCDRMSDLDAKIYAFDSFDAAKSAARKIMKGLAYSENAMFDGDGNLVQLMNYTDDCWDPSEDGEEWDDALTKEKLITVREAIRKIFMGVDAVPDIEEGDFTDYMIAYCYKNGEIRFYGDDDGPCNGYDPVIRTNMFSMEEEKDYFLYIDDMFGQDEATSELYIDLCEAQTFEG